MENVVKSRAQIKEVDTWDLEKVYPNVDQWEKDFEELKEKALKIKEYAGKMGESSELLSYLMLNEELSRLLDRLFIFAHLRADEDTANTTFQIIKSKIDGYLAEFKSYTAFFVPEILSLPQGNIERFLKEVPELKLYEFMLQDILSSKPHVLGKAEEELLASVSDALDGPGNIFNILSNADLTFPKIKNEEGTEVELTEGNYSSFIKSKDRRVREEAFKALFETYGKFKNTFATSLTCSIKNFLFNSKVRKYENGIESSLKPNHIPVEVYENTIETVHKNISALHRYVRIKKKLLGLQEIHMYDLYVSTIDTPKEHILFEDAISIAKEGLAPLGTEYLSIFEEGIKNRWIDIYENKGKRGGAYSWGCYDTMPYVLLNYNYDYHDVSTFVHEMGHSIHSYYSRKTQPYIYSEYTLFCAEVASTTNECLLIHHLIEKEKDEKKKLYLINQELEQIRTTVFRQVMFAEFEKITHENLEKGIPLSSTELCAIWHELNEKYFGEDMIVDQEVDMEWARIPHFYSDFYVYQYATGYAAASCFANAILSKEENGLVNYLGFLKSGGSGYSIELLKKAGVDMRTAKPLELTIQRFEKLLDMLEAIL